MKLNPKFITFYPDYYTLKNGSTRWFYSNSQIHNISKLNHNIRLLKKVIETRISKFYESEKNNENIFYVTTYDRLRS